MMLPPPSGQTAMPNQLIEQAKQHLANLILPKKITPYEIERYYRKAHRTRAWRNLRPEARALLYFLRKWVKPIKSRTLTETLRQIFLTIELVTTKAKALLQGIITTMRNGLNFIFSLNSAKALSKLIAIGLNQLNNPLNSQCGS